MCASTGPRTRARCECTAHYRQTEHRLDRAQNNSTAKVITLTLSRPLRIRGVRLCKQMLDHAVCKCSENAGMGPEDDVAFHNAGKQTTQYTCSVNLCVGSCQGSGTQPGSKLTPRATTRPTMRFRWKNNPRPQLHYENSVRKQPNRKMRLKSRGQALRNTCNPALG